MWGWTYPTRYQAPSGGDFDKAGKSQRSPHTQVGWKTNRVRKKVLQLEDRHNKHWPAKSYNQLRCVSGLLMAKERAQHISAQDVTWACTRMRVWCLVSRNITLKWICSKGPQLWILRIVIKVIQAATDVHATTRIIWVINYLHQILYNAYHSQD
jgi:hypothetical protein